MYSNQDKKDFILKDMKSAIGMGLGNAFAKAVDLVIALDPRGKEQDAILTMVNGFRDLFFKENQEKITNEWNDWLAKNENGLDMTLGLGVKDNPEPL